MLAPFFALLIAAAPVGLESATAAFDAGDFEQSLAQAGRALESPSLASADRAQLQLLRARCLAALRRSNEVDEAIEAALNADPGLQLDERTVSPGLRATVTRLRSQLAAQVTVSVAAAPAAVRINDVMVGRAPVTQLLPVGRYRISALDDQGAVIATRDVVVAPRQQLQVALEPAAVVVAAPAPGAAPSPWPVMPALSLRGVVDPSAGAAFEGGVSLLGRYWLVEADAVLAGGRGAGLRAGARIPFGGRFSAQLTADGVLFFRPSVVAGAGATLGAGVQLGFVELLAEVSGRWVDAEHGYRSTYALIALSLRVRWPFAEGP